MKLLASYAPSGDGFGVTLSDVETQAIVQHIQSLPGASMVQLNQLERAAREWCARHGHEIAETQSAARADLALCAE